MQILNTILVLAEIRVTSHLFFSFLISFPINPLFEQKKSPIYLSLFIKTTTWYNNYEKWTFVPPPLLPLISLHWPLAIMLKSWLLERVLTYSYLIYIQNIDTCRRVIISL